MKKGPGRLAAVADGLKKALMNEIEGREFYRMAARNAATAGARRMFEFLGDEEERHREAILAQVARMAEGKAPGIVRGAASRKGIGAFRSPLFTPDFVARGTNVEGEAAALSVGMTLEKRAIAQFVALRKKAAGDAAAEKLFDDLAAWERDHLDVLARQYGQLREMYWEEARFWPF
ncbi:MAG: ferritin-like domain-containing protein [Gemmatimonadota bacterium]